MATNTVKVISIKDQSGSGYNSKPVGAEAENIEVPLGSDGRVLENAVDGVSRKESLSKVLRDNLFKPDGTTIMVDEDGVTLHGASTYELPAATTSTLGGVKADGTTITVDPDGTIHGSSSVSADDALSNSSENPVQNKVVTGKLNNAGYLSDTLAGDTPAAPRDADTLGGVYRASDIAAIENPIFDDSGADPEITSFETFKSTFRSQLSLGNLFKKIKAGLGFVVDKSMVVSNLTSTDDTLALSASQGKLLKDEINTLNSNLTTSDETVFRFATDGEGNYGYLGADDSFIPFKSGAVECDVSIHSVSAFQNNGALYSSVTLYINGESVAGFYYHISTSTPYTSGIQKVTIPLN